MKNEVDTAEGLNQDLILEIFSYLKPESGFILRRVNKEWNEYKRNFVLKIFPDFCHQKNSLKLQQIHLWF
jgi:hypothetical protein